MKKKKTSLRIFTLLALLLSMPAIAQLDTVHYMPPCHGPATGTNNPQDQYIYLSTTVTTTFTVTIRSGDGTLLATRAISRSAPSVYSIGTGSATRTFVVRDSLATVLKTRGLILTAPQPFYANFRVRGGNSGIQAEMISCQGRAGLGTTFRAGVAPTASATSDRSFFASFMATQNNTTVTVSGYDPNVVFSGPGTTTVTLNTITITLNKGQSYVLSGYSQSNAANLNGFVGALIAADKPIAVNNGNWTGTIENTANSQDIMANQAVPVERIGTDYVCVRGNGNDPMEQPLVIAHSNNTEVFIGTSTTPFATLNAGDYVLIPESNYAGTLHENMYIRTSLPAYLYQPLGGNTGTATPGMNFIPPVSCLLPKEAVIPDVDSIGASPFSGDLVILTKSTTLASNLQVNGSPILASTAQTIAGLPGWVSYRINGINGDADIVSTEPMSAAIFGYSGAAGYAGYYSGFGTAAGASYSVAGGSCLPGTLQAIPTSGVVYQWLFNGAPISGATSSSYTPTNAGNYQVIVSSSSGGCIDTTGITTLFTPPSASNAGSNDTLCGLTTTLAANAPTNGTGTWSLISGPPSETANFTDVNSPTSSVTVSAAGVYRFAWTIETGGTCPTSVGFVQILFRAIPATPNPSSNSPVCTGFPLNLTTADVPGATFSWAGPNNFNAATRNPTISAPTVADSGTYSVTVTLDGCTSDTGTTLAVVTFCIDTDGDGVPDIEDVDDDNDGLRDMAESTGDTDGDGIIDALDLDSDNDGIVDVIENGGVDTDGNGTLDGFVDADSDGLNDLIDASEGGSPLPSLDIDLDGILNSVDLDSDGDGITDVKESGGTDTNNDGQADATADSNGNGLDDALDPSQGGTPQMTTGTDTNSDGRPNSYPDGNTDGNGRPDFMDLDSDGDGIVDVIEGQSTAGYTAPSGNDNDSDGIDDAYDTTTGFGGSGVNPANSDGTAEPDYQDTDADNDLLSDAIEGWDTDGDGTANTLPAGNDADNDGIDDNYDNANGWNPDNGQTPSSFPNLSNAATAELDWRETEDNDGDGILDDVDLDDDNDGVQDAIEGTGDTDGDGIVDAFDLDADNDGIADVIEAGGSDPDGDGIIGSGTFTDTDGDGLSDLVDTDNGGTALPNPDSDNDGITDTKDVDSDNDGITDVIEAGGTDADGDGLLDNFNDTDGDGLSDAVNSTTGGTALDNPDSDNDGVTDARDVDSDNDGVTDVTEAGGMDTNGDGILDGFIDTDGDGLSDVADTDDGGTPLANPDTDNDGVPNALDVDSDNDGITDVIEAGGVDANGDGRIDGFTDGDSDGLADVLDTNASGTPLPTADADGDGISNGLDLDSDGDGITDIRETGGTDANGDGQLDSTTDSDGDGLADTVDPTTSGTPTITTGSEGTTVDGRPDSYPMDNTDGDGSPDFLDIDSDGDGIVDIIEAQTTSAYTAPSGTDTDGDGIDNTYDATSGFGGTGLTPINTDNTDAPDYLDSDSDNDGFNDLTEGNDFDNNNQPDTAPTGQDSDGDGLDNAYDNITTTGSGNTTNGDSPSSSTFADVDTPGGELDWRDPIDTDGDGVPNGEDIDDDNDGILDTVENLTAEQGGDTDGDGIADQLDLDSDNDGIADVIEAGGTDPDNDGRIGSGSIIDTNSDGLADDLAPIGLTAIDTDGDDKPNFQDLDSDNDGLNDITEAGGNRPDTNGDGQLDGADSDNDGLLDAADPDNGGVLTVTPVDADSDGKADYTDVDSDGDGINDVVENGQGNLDQNGDGKVDGADTDGDGIIDAVDGANGSFGDAGTAPVVDADGDGTPNYLDTDSDGDTRPDGEDDEVPTQDCDNDGISNYLDTDECDVTLSIPEGFSPNGDGKNDFLIIAGIEQYASNNIKIFNRWGNLVYEAEKYDNSTTRWDGNNQGDLSSGKGQVPEATYFYVLDLGDGSEVKKGYIYIKY